MVCSSIPGGPQNKEKCQNSTSARDFLETIFLVDHGVNKASQGPPLFCGTCTWGRGKNESTGLGSQGGGRDLPLPPSQATTPLPQGSSGKGALGTTFGRLGPEGASRPGLLHTNPIMFPGSLGGVPTLLFLKPDKNRACSIVSSAVTNLGFAQARPD